MAEWNSGLFGCFNDPKICIIGMCCPCVLHGLNASQVVDTHPIGPEAINKAPISIGVCCVAYSCCGCCVHCVTRGKLREKFGLAPSCPDLIAAWCCGPCALCQDGRELKARGHAPNFAAPKGVPGMDKGKGKGKKKGHNKSSS
eukprot:TRINITY_DN5114_c2_g3_i2.p1 TRINITY_DN5114_c2_g3~~TRINITY_DN5114_c2_g3_i2.p1  ORF type:complete len:143 (-),score=34.54 TRINITY_DN5114_c2_g3_i2:510-938(-)